MCTKGLGCVKFSKELTSTVDPNPHWSYSPWNEMDGAVSTYLESHNHEIHIHMPPVAHVKPQMTTTS